MVPIGSNNSAVCRCRSVVNVDGLRYLPTEESSPEKAGVGGSIPSLATTRNLPSAIDMWALLNAVVSLKSPSLESKLISAQFVVSAVTNGVPLNSTLTRCGSVLWYPW